MLLIVFMLSDFYLRKIGKFISNSNIPIGRQISTNNIDIQIFLLRVSLMKQVKGTDIF